MLLSGVTDTAVLAYIFIYIYITFLINEKYESERAFFPTAPPRHCTYEYSWAVGAESLNAPVPRVLMLLRNEIIVTSYCPCSRSLARTRANLLEM